MFCVRVVMIAGSHNVCPNGQTCQHTPNWVTMGLQVPDVGPFELMRVNNRTSLSPSLPLLLLRWSLCVKEAVPVTRLGVWVSHS